MWGLLDLFFTPTAPTPPASAEQFGGGQQRYQRLVRNPGLAIALADDDEEFAALLQLTQQRKSR